MADFSGRLLVVDTETTGTDTASDRIVELAAVIFVGGRYVDRRNMLLQPGVPIPEEASLVHGIRDDDVRDKPSFRDIADRFAQHVDGRAYDGIAPVLVGYNAVAYDVPLLNAELERHGHSLRIDVSRVVDPVIFVRHHLRHLRSRRLGDVCAYFGVTLANAHRAWADARATGDLLFAMIERGFIPNDIDAALALQHSHSAALEHEWSEFSYWLYRDRLAGELRLGAGKHCGLRLDEVDPTYLAYIVENVLDLPPLVRGELERRLRA